MSSHTNQVFSTPTPRRWNLVKRVTLSLIGMVVLAFIGLIVSYTNAFKPDLPRNYSQLQDSLAKIAKDTTISWSQAAVQPCCQGDRPTCFAPLSNGANVPLSQQIRAGFFVNWDPQSYYTLKAQIDKINMVLPEWFVVSDADTVVFKPDERAFQLLREHPFVAVVPLLSNFWQDEWHGENVQRILDDPHRQAVFIESLVHNLKHYGFKGVNIDFEALQDSTADQLHNFMGLLHNRLNSEGFTLSQSIVPLNNQYDPKKLVEVNDLLFVMAYNQHLASTRAGNFRARTDGN